LDPGFQGHLRLSPWAIRGPGARFLEFLYLEPHGDDTSEEVKIELLYRRCCGLDVHKETVVACLRLVSDGKVTTEVRTFQTTTANLLRLSEWLAENECTHVAMEVGRLLQSAVRWARASAALSLPLHPSGRYLEPPPRCS
jgi:hypothetical protein